MAVPTAAGTGVLYPYGHGLHYPVTPAAVTFVDRPGRGQDAYVVPEAQGVDYLVGGAVVELGTHRSNRDVTVRAVPQGGYELAAGATTECTSDFTVGNPGKGARPGHADRPGGPRG